MRNPAHDIALTGLHILTDVRYAGNNSHKKVPTRVSLNPHRPSCKACGAAKRRVSINAGVTHASLQTFLPPQCHGDPPVCIPCQVRNIPCIKVYDKRKRITKDKLRAQATTSGSSTSGESGETGINVRIAHICIHFDTANNVYYCIHIEKDTDDAHDGQRSTNTVQNSDHRRRSSETDHTAALNRAGVPAPNNNNPPGQQTSSTPSAQSPLTLPDDAYSSSSPATADPTFAGLPNHNPAPWTSPPVQHAPLSHTNLSVSDQSDPADTTLAQLFCESHRTFLLRKLITSYPDTTSARPQ